MSEEKKAYDLKDLIGMWKLRGIDLGEDAAKGMTDDLFVWLDQSAKISKTLVDDMAMVVHPQLKAMIIGLADKIDGKEG